MNSNRIALRSMHVFRGTVKRKLKQIAVAAMVTGLIAGAATATAVEDKISGSGAQAECTAFKSAAETAMKNHLSIVNSFMSGATSQMQAAVSKNNSCIGNLALLDFDLSKLIPDFGLLGTILQTVLDKIVTGVINKACSAISDVIAKPGNLWNSIMGKIDLNGQFQDWASGIDYKLPSVVGGDGVGSGSEPTTPIRPDIKLPVTCTETVGGTVCTDGSTSGSGISADTPSGTEIGAQYAMLMEACSGALNRDAETGQPVSAGSQAACNALQDFINKYAPYIDPAGIPKYPGWVLITPPDAGSAVCNTPGVCVDTGNKPGGNTGGSAGGLTPDFWDKLLGNGSGSSQKASKQSYSLPVRQ